METTPLHLLGKEIAQKNGFVIDKEIYRGEYYSKGFVRDVIFSGSYQGKPAVLKIYDDPRVTDEPIAQMRFHEKNASQLLQSLEIYAYKIDTPRKGWLIMEQLPSGSAPFTSPMSAKNRNQFLRLYVEYRKNFPEIPERTLTLVENLPPDDFHALRIAEWLQLASNKEVELVNSGQSPTINPVHFLPLYKKGLDAIRKEFRRRKMIWCHGHFKPHDIFIDPNKETYYLTDFAHVKMLPEGYELAFIAWADWLMAADWNMEYREWKKGIDTWIKELSEIADTLRIENHSSLITTSLIERIFGTILADVTASDRLPEEKNNRISLLYQLLNDLLR